MSIHNKKRELVAVNSFRSASETIGKVTKGMNLFSVTRGQFSMIDAILSVMDQVGPCHLSIWTWTVASYEVDVLYRLMMDKRLLSAILIIDKGAQKKNATIIDDWIAKFGNKSVKWVVNHAKIATITTDEYKFLLRGSMNLNFNPRFENFDISEGCSGYELIKEIENDLPFLPHDASNAEIRQASGLNQAFTVEQLSIFNQQTLKVWNK